MDGYWYCNLLEPELDAYSLAYRVDSQLNQLSGMGKEPFRQQAYTNPLKFVTLLHRFADRYVTLQDLYRVVLGERWLAE